MPHTVRRPQLRPGPDAATAYRGIYRRIDALLRNRAEIADLRVPACPAWTIRETVAHLAGTAQDINSRNLEGVGSDTWTRAQVDRTADCGMDELLDRWSVAIDPVMARLSQNGLERPAAQLVFDSLTHEHDIRGALGEPGARGHDPAFVVALGFLTITYDEMATKNKLPALELTTPTLGTLQLGDPLIATEHVCLSVSDFEALRAFGGRRSVRQLSTLPWHGEPMGVLIALGNNAIRPPMLDLIE